MRKRKDNGFKKNKIKLNKFKENYITFFALCMLFVIINVCKPNTNKLNEMET